MRNSVRIVAATVIVAAVGLHAQQNFVPKKPTDADWAAVAKLPDFTGVWEASFGGPAGRGGGGRGRAGGAPAFPAGPQLTAAYAEKRRANQAKGAEDSQTANCLPPGMPGIMGQPYPMEFLLTPGLVTIVIEAYSQVRHIYTDGRPLPDDPDPKFFGTSIGRWDGGTLVVETRGFRDNLWIDTWGSPMSDAGKMTEKFRRPNFGTLEIELTIDDPKVYTRPFTVNLTQNLEADTELVDEFCLEGEKDYERLQRSRGK